MTTDRQIPADLTELDQPDPELEAAMASWAAEAAAFAAELDRQLVAHAAELDSEWDRILAEIDGDPPAAA